MGPAFASFSIGDSCFDLTTVLLEMNEVGVLRFSFALGGDVNEKIEPVEIGIVFHQSFDLLVVRGDQVGGCREKVLHQSEFFFAKSDFGENHFIGAFYRSGQRA